MSKCECWTDCGVPPVKWLCAKCQNACADVIVVVE